VCNWRKLQILHGHVKQQGTSVLQISTSCLRSTQGTSSLVLKDSNLQGKLILQQYSWSILETSQQRGSANGRARRIGSISGACLLIRVLQALYLRTVLCKSFLYISAVVVKYPATNTWFSGPGACLSIHGVKCKAQELGLLTAGKWSAAG
jgi:hypothetical protein